MPASNPSPTRNQYGFYTANLFLYTVNGDGALGSLVRQSIASSGNIEEIWAVDLLAGNYVIQVAYAGNTSGNKTSYSYALAWESSNLSIIPEPPVGLFLATGLLLVFGIRVIKRRTPSVCRKVISNRTAGRVGFSP